MKILVRHEPPKIEEAGVSPVGRDEEIGRAGSRLQAGGQKFPGVVGEICAARRYLWPTGDRRLRRSALRIAAVEAILHEEQHVAQSGSIRQQRAAGNLEMVGDNRDNHGEIEIRMKAPGEIEIAFV